MNNSKMWLVVKPTVGIPLFLGAVAVGSFAVHVSVLTNTGWVSDFLQGNEIGSSASASLATEGNTSHASFDAQALDGQAVLVTLPDGTTARAVLELPKTLAAADSAIQPDG
ncbi:MAG: light-harvesting protein [Aestuariivita sp.]|uniref:light-harvesting protein n=1 Tax=Aestuariivita sp. TaxID=1872407 RepID=UPI003BAF611E